MCNEHQIISMVDLSDKSRKKNTKLHYVFMDFLTKQHFVDGKFVTICEPGKPPTFSFKKTVCVATAIIAFVLGLTVGILIPLYLVPSSQSSFTTPNEWLTARQSDYTENKTSPSYETVSFVGSPGVTRRKGSLANRFRRLLDTIYWSNYVEASLPTGFVDLDEERWSAFVEKTPIVKIEEGCGRMQNRLVTFEDGTKACCRYRQNTDQIQGEIFSYYLGRLMKLNNLVPSSLALIKTNGHNWRQVKNQITLAQWAEDRPVVLTKYIENITPAKIPKSLRKFTRKLHPIDVVNSDRFFRTDDNSDADDTTNNIDTIDTNSKIKMILDQVNSQRDVVELAQWSDLIIFDYLTANLDRIVNNLYNLQWNPEMMDSPAHNLAKSEDTNLLLFLDNESGLLHGYRLLEKYEPYHSLLLDALCVFRKPTVEMLTKLSLDGNIGSLLNTRLQHKDMIPLLPDKSISILNNRLDRVLRQVSLCASQYIAPS